MSALPCCPWCPLACGTRTGRRQERGLVMAFNWRKAAALGLLGLCWLAGPLVLAADESPAVEPDASRMIGRPNPDGGGGRLLAQPDGRAQPAPVTVRHWNYRDADAVPECLDVPEGAWVTVVDHTFTTGPDTTYIELNYNGQFNVPGGPGTFNGIVLWTYLEQNGNRIPFPGGGEGFNPFISRRDLASNGQYMFGALGNWASSSSRFNIILVKEIPTSDSISVPPFATCWPITNPTRMRRRASSNLF